MLILLLTLVLGWLSWWANARTVANLSEQLMTEMTERIAQTIDRHTYGTGPVLEAAFPDGMPAPKNMAEQEQALLTRLYTAASIFTDTTDYVYYGNELGQGIGVQKHDDGSAQVRLKLSAESPRDFLHLNNINARPEYRFTENSVFDPRSRVWYQLGREAEQHTWTAVYLDFGTRELVVTRARKVLDEQGEFAGVVATDLFLSGLSRFVRQLPITAGSRAFIVEPSGELIAASSIANVRSDGEDTVRVSALDSGDPLIEQAWRSMQGIVQQHDKNAQPVAQLEFTDTEGQQVFLSVKYVRDDAGLGWYAVVAVPSSDILAGVRSNSLLVIHIGVLALLALLVGWLVFGRVAKDIVQLSAAVKSTGRDMTDISRQARRSDEIGVLARSFSQMRAELFTDRLTAVANRTALDCMLQDLLDARRESEQPFAVLFLDLNKFKPLNDNLGHAKGDLALIEVARRIRVTLGEHDLVARMGGDEFVVVLRDAEPGAVLDEFCQRLQDIIAQPLGCCDDYVLGVSIGCACYPQHGCDIKSLLKYADNQMYTVKNEQR